MTPDIERLAKEAGLEWLAALAGPAGKDRVTMYAVTPKQLAKFAALIAKTCAEEECEDQTSADNILARFPMPEAK